MSLDMYVPSEYDEKRATRGISAINEDYEERDRDGRGNCRRCDRQGMLNRQGFCSIDCENGQVKLPYQGD